MKKIIFLIFIILTGCSASQKYNKKISQEPIFNSPQYTWGKVSENPLVIWTKEKELNRNYMVKAFERYEKLTGNKLKIIEIPADKFEEKTSDAFSKGGEKPDILLSYGGTNIENYLPDENFYDFTNTIWVDDLTDTSINQTIYNGKIIGLPHWEASISGTLYNKKLFKKHNIEIPKNQKEFMEVCEKLSENNIIPVYLPYKEISMLLYQFPLDVIVQDTEILTKLNNGNINYSDIKEMEKIINWYKEMSEKGYFGISYKENDWNGMNDAMESEKYAMMLCWDTWLYTDFKGNPNDFGIMPAFIGIPDTGTFEGPNLALLIVNKHSSNVETAIDFITFMADPYNYNTAFEGIYTAPVFKNQVTNISTPQYVEAERLIDKNFHDSTAWLRIRGFSQMDAVCIQKYMDNSKNYSINQCLNEMDTLRKNRISNIK